MYERYGDLNWWPADTADEVIIGAMLTQNTSWKNVEKCMERLRSEKLNTLKAISGASLHTISENIRSSGFYNQKAQRLKMISVSIVRVYGSLESMCNKNSEELEKFLLSLRGVGPETMESIMLYACEKPFFVVDKYTVRILGRIGFPDIERGTLRSLVEAEFHGDLKKLKNYHAMFVETGKNYCRKVPDCDGCPLNMVCSYSMERRLP